MKPLFKNSMLFIFCGVIVCWHALNISVHDIKFVRAFADKIPNVVIFVLFVWFCISLALFFVQTKISVKPKSIFMLIGIFICFPIFMNSAYYKFPILAWISIAYFLILVFIKFARSKKE